MPTAPDAALHGHAVEMSGNGRREWHHGSLNSHGKCERATPAVVGSRLGEAATPDSAASLFARAEVRVALLLRCRAVQ